MIIKTLRDTLDKDAEALKVLRKFTFNSVQFIEIKLARERKLETMIKKHITYYLLIKF